jgi:hypothetical protein
VSNARCSIVAFVQTWFIKKNRQREYSKVGGSDIETKREKRKDAESRDEASQPYIDGLTHL